MSEKKYTERDMVLAKREAFLAGEAWSRDISPRYIFTRQEDVLEAAKRYPLPKVTRPRVVTDPYGVRWRLSALPNHHKGRTEVCLEWQEGSDSRWHGGLQSFVVTAPRAAVFSDLFANPTEEVEDDA